MPGYHKKTGVGINSSVWTRHDGKAYIINPTLPLNTLPYMRAIAAPLASTLNRYLHKVSIYTNVTDFEHVPRGNLSELPFSSALNTSHGRSALWPPIPLLQQLQTKGPANVIDSWWWVLASHASLDVKY